MTGLFSTGESSTALFGESGVLIDWTPAVIIIAASLAAYAGATISTNAQLELNPVISTVYPGSYIEWNPVSLYIEPQLKAFGGITVDIASIHWTFAYDQMSAMGGGMAGFYTDVVLWHTEPTAMFSTGMRLIERELYRKGNILTFKPAFTAQAGTIVVVNADIEMAFNSHGPVARKRRINSQIILS